MVPALAPAPTSSSASARGSMIEAQANERIGRTLRGKWHLDALIDVGGMAAVYAATHRNGGRAAIKILHRERSAMPEIARRFLREGYIANAVGHPGAVRVLDDDVAEDGSVFLVMELLEGATLHDRALANGGRLEPQDVMLAADQVLAVLGSAHAAGIVHRDIKPENLFLTREGRVKVLDFGIARLPSVPSPAEAHTTQNGAQMGTPAFMAPEQARGRFDLVGPASDLWALGATMFTLLTGRLVHDGATASELIAASFTKPAPPLTASLPGAHPELAAVVDRALALRLADRWTDAESMRAALSAAFATMFGEPLPERDSMPRVVVRVSPRTDVEHLLRTIPSTGGRTRPSRLRLPGRRRDWALAIASAVVSFGAVTALAHAIATTH